MSNWGEPRPLSEVAKETGYGLSDIAIISGLDESTISRLWENRDWVGRISGRSLQRLASSIPGIAEYFINHSIENRKDDLIAELGSHGLGVNADSIYRSEIDVQYVLNALEVALLITKGNKDKSHQYVSSYLARFWGRKQDLALEALYSDDKERGLLVNPGKLTESSVRLVPRLGYKKYSFHSILAKNILTHQVMKSTGGLGEEVIPKSIDRQSAFMMRGAVMASLIVSDDYDLVEKYEDKLSSTPVCMAVEEWSFPTYMGDCRATTDFVLPRSLLLNNTASEVIREIKGYGEGYLYYLAKIYIPLALERDPTFGLKISQLKDALEWRASSCKDPRTRKACHDLIQKIGNGKNY